MDALWSKCVCVHVTVEGKMFALLKGKLVLVSVTLNSKEDCVSKDNCDDNTSWYYTRGYTFTVQMYRQEFQISGGYLKKPERPVSNSNMKIKVLQEMLCSQHLCLVFMIPKRKQML